MYAANDNNDIFVFLNGIALPRWHSEYLESQKSLLG